MASGPPSGHPPAVNTPFCFYPAYCNKASSTYFSWVKLTASDIHHSLRSRPGFASHDNNLSYQRTTSANPASVYFYLNHPVQFVCVVGIVIAFAEYERLWVFTVDDGSGATIDVICRKPEKPEQHEEYKPAQKHIHTLPAGAATSEACSAATVAEGVDARVEVLSRIDIGSVVKVKGTIGQFRSVRQITLERLQTVPDTNAEVRFWIQRMQLLADVLSKPWRLSAEEQKRLLKEAEGEVAESKERAARRVERAAKAQRRERRRAQKIAKAYEAEEREREKVAEEMRQHGRELQLARQKNREQGRPVKMS